MIDPEWSDDLSVWNSWLIGIEVIIFPDLSIMIDPEWSDDLSVWKSWLTGIEVIIFPDLRLDWSGMKWWFIRMEVMIDRDQGHD